MSYIGNQPVLNTSEYREEFAVTSTQTVFNTGGFTASSDSATLEVLRNGVLLGTADYTLGSDASTVTLANAAVNGDIIVIKGRRELTNGVQVTERRHEHTMGSGETTVTFPYPLTVSQTDVYLNGVKLGSSDFSINSSTRVVSFTTNPAVGDLVAIVSREPALTANSSLPVVDAAGNNVLSESGGVVTLTVDEANVGSNALVVDASGDVSIKGDSGGVIFDVNSQTTTDNVIFATFRGGLSINALQFASYRFASQNDRTGLYWENQGVGNIRMWMDDSLLLRVSSGWPTAHNSGTVVGTQSSDMRLKNILGNVEYGLSEILQLIPKKFSFKTEPEVEQIGFLAQEVLPVIPEAVFDSKDVIEGHENEGTKLGMTYVSLIPVLVNAIKEQQVLIESQQSQIDALTTRIEALEDN